MTTKLSARLQKMKFMQRSKGKTKSARLKRKRESKKKIPGVEHSIKKQKTGVIVDEAMVINKIPGRRSFKNFNSCLERSLKLGRDYDKDIDSKQEDLEKKPKVEKGGTFEDPSAKGSSSSAPQQDHRRGNERLPNSKPFTEDRPPRFREPIPIV